MDKVVELVGGGSVINGLTLSSSLLNVKKGDLSRLILNKTNFILPQNGVLQSSPSYGLGLTAINMEGQLETRL